MEHYIKQYKELAHLNGRPVKEVSDHLKEGITNQTEEYLDANYKDLLVTFTIKEGIATLSRSVEMYNTEGVFLGRCIFTDSGEVLEVI